MRTRQRLFKNPALWIGTAVRSDTSHDINEIVIITGWPPKCWRLRTPSSSLSWSRKSGIHSSPFLTATVRSEATRGFAAKLTVESSSSIVNSPSAELDTTSVDGVVALLSSDELAIVNSNQDVAFELLHGGFLFSSTITPNILTSSLINCMPVVTPFPETHRGATLKCA